MTVRKQVAVEAIEPRNEKGIALQMHDILSRRLDSRFRVHVGKSILYKIEVDALGKVTPDSVDSPMRGQYAFQTDILIEARNPSIPLVVVELKYGNFSTHDVITYSSKAARHKDIYPYLRYGFIVVGKDAVLGRHFITHNQNFDFAMAIGNLAVNSDEWITVVERQLENAEQLSNVMRSNRIKLIKYEEVVDLVGVSQMYPIDNTLPQSVRGNRDAQS